MTYLNKVILTFIIAYLVFILQKLFQPVFMEVQYVQQTKVESFLIKLGIGKSQSPTLLGLSY